MIIIIIIEDEGVVHLQVYRRQVVTKLCTRLQRTYLGLAFLPQSGNG